MLRKNFECRFCSERFTRLDNLRRHETCKHEGSECSEEEHPNKRLRIIDTSPVSEMDCSENESDEESESGDDSDSSEADAELDDEAFLNIIQDVPKVNSTRKYLAAFLNEYKAFLYTLYFMEESPVHINVWDQVKYYMEKKKTLEKAIHLAIVDYEEALTDVLQRYVENEYPSENDEDGEDDEDEGDDEEDDDD